MWGNAKRSYPTISHMAAAVCLCVLIGKPAAALELRADLRETAESGVAAKEKAMAGAAAKALEGFVRDSVSSRNQGRALALMARNEARLVESVFVEREVIGPGAYEAQLRFIIREGALRQILAEAGIPFVTEKAPPVLVVPYERSGEGLAINPDGAWFKAWEAAPRSNGMAPFSLPRPPFSGKLFDEVTLAMPLEEQMFHLGVRFGTRSVTFAILDMSDDWSVHLWGEDAIGAMDARLALSALRGAPETGLVNAVSDSLRLFDDRWKDAAAQPLAEMHDILQRVRVPLLHGTAEWTGIERQIRSRPEIRRIELTHLAETHAEANLFIAGGTEGLVQALEEDFVVLQAEDGILVLRPNGQ